MPGRSTTDAIFILKQTIEKHREGQKDIRVTIIDIDKAYDRVPREEIWRCMRERNVPEKYVKLIQDMYRGCKTKVRSAAGESDSFNVDVGLHQGSALSPYLFLILMDVLTEGVRKEVPESMMFADDIVLCGGREVDITEYLDTWRKSLEERGMRLSRPRTQFMDFNFEQNQQGNREPVNILGEELERVTHFKYLGTSMEEEGGMETEITKRVGAGWRNWKTCSGVLCDRRMPVKLKGKVYKTVIRPAMFLHWRVAREHPRRWRCRCPSRRACMCMSGSVYQCRRKWRLRPLTYHTAAPECERTFPTTRGLAVHRTRWCRPGQRPASRRGQLADKAVKLVKRQASAALLQSVVMEGESLETVYQFDYLGCRFTSDGDDAADMRHRMAIAGERSRRLDYLWRDNRLPRSLKLRLYAASVCSTLTHGSEAWILTPRALATLNGFDYRQLHLIIGRSYREEATTPSCDLLTAVRTRRHQWLGHIPRMPANRLVRRAVLALGQRAGPPYQPGSILMDAPFPLDELVLRAADRRGWARDTRSLSSLQESP